jgi:uncharacterized membrane protein YsdA (DUF1294 family)
MNCLSIKDFLLIYLSMSGMTFIFFAIDKMNAWNDVRRIPENVLMALSFFFGWPGGLLAMRIMRHKTQKISFQVKIGIAVLANLVLAGYLLYGFSCYF